MHVSIEIPAGRKSQMNDQQVVAYVEMLNRVLGGLAHVVIS